MSRIRAMPAVLAVVMVAAVLVAGITAGALLAEYNRQTNPDPGDRDGLTPENLKSLGSPVAGDPSAPVTILEFGDYQCTFCYRFHGTTLEALREGYVETGRVNLAFADFPLNGPDSVLAAEASRCAGDQGGYWPYHDELYGNWGGERTGWITREALSGFAAAAVTGIDQDRFERCLDRQLHRQAVLRAYDTGRDLGIDATPSFLVFNGEEAVKIRGNQPLEVFERAILSLE